MTSRKRTALAAESDDGDEDSITIVQELCESRGGRPELSVLTSLLVSVDVKNYEPCFGIGLNLSLICQLTSEDIKHHFIIISHYQSHHSSGAV